MHVHNCTHVPPDGRSHLRCVNTAGRSTMDPEASLPRVTRTCGSPGASVSGALHDGCGLCGLPLRGGLALPATLPFVPAVLFCPPRVTATARERGSRPALLLLRCTWGCFRPPRSWWTVRRRTFVPSSRNRNTVLTAALSPGAAGRTVRKALSAQGQGSAGAPGDWIHKRHVRHVQRCLYCYDAALLLLCALHVLLHLAHAHPSVSSGSRAGQGRAGRTRLKPSTTTLFWSRSTRAMVPTSPLSLPAMIFTCDSTAASVQSAPHTRQTATCLVPAQDFPVREQLAEATGRHSKPDALLVPSAWAQGVRRSKMGPWREGAWFVPSAPRHRAASKQRPSGSRSAHDPRAAGSRRIEASSNGNRARPGHSSCASDVRITQPPGRSRLCTLDSLPVLAESGESAFALTARPTSPAC
jgi:hypothetical protein